jgi:transposase
MANVKTVVTDGKNSESFQMFRRFRQGSVLSPVLFNKVMNEIIRRVTEV